MSKTRKRKLGRRRVSTSSSSVSFRAKVLSGGDGTSSRSSGSKRADLMQLIPPRTKKVRAFTKKDFHSGDGMLTTVWGPSMWHFMHTMSFNYPVTPTQEQKRHYMDFVLNLRNVLPCKYCRMNLTNNLATRPIRMCNMESRDTFSRFVYDLHETVNRLLGKKSGLTYCDVRERYEHFRSRCTQDAPKVFNFKDFYKNRTGTRKNGDKHEKGCTEPLYGKKAKCVISIVPQEVNVPTFSVDDQCIKKRGEVVDDEGHS
jgi:Erv1 / Alr family